MNRIAAVPLFFALRIASALLLLKLSASWLQVPAFAVFSQLLLFGALLNLLAAGGAQNGLIRQAAAAAGPEDLARTHSAGLMIWIVAAAVCAVAVGASSRLIARVLVGDPGDWAAVLAIALIALAAGPGQVWCSLLSARGRAPLSLAAQALGLLGGAGAAAWLIIRGEAALAAVAYACGGLVAMAAALAFALPLRIALAPFRAARAEVRVLLRYSAAFAATAGFSSVLLFALRSLYRDRFGAHELGYWLAANRISDMSTQLVGLFMIQVFVPHMAMTPDADTRRGLAVRAGAGAALVMALIPVVFAAASKPLVHLFLSDAYLPAIPAIQTYMVGDVLRVWPSLAMYAAFAEGRPGRYAAIEIGALSLMAGLILALTAAGQARAPQFGYLGAYGLAALAVTWALLAPRPPVRAPA